MLNILYFHVAKDGSTIARCLVENWGQEERIKACRLNYLKDKNTILSNQGMY